MDQKMRSKLTIFYRIPMSYIIKRYTKNTIQKLPHQLTLSNSKSSGLTRSGYSARIWVLSTKLFRLLAAFLLEKQSEYQNIYFEYCGKFKTKIWFVFFWGGKPCPTCKSPIACVFDKFLWDHLEGAMPCWSRRWLVNRDSYE